MKSRVDQLYYEYCAVKPRYFVRVYDTLVNPYPVDNIEESDSIDIYINIVM